MLQKLSRTSVAIGLLLVLLGCPDNEQSGDKAQQGGEQGGKAKAQSAEGPSELDKELKRQGDIYKELLKHNAKNAQQQIEEDRKLLRKMEKNQQEINKNRLQTLQEKQGLIGTEETKEDKQGQQGQKDQESQQGENRKR
jgi:hypothetical protein